MKLVTVEQVTDAPIRLLDKEHSPTVDFSASPPTFLEQDKRLRISLMYQSIRYVSDLVLEIDRWTSHGSSARTCTVNPQLI